MKQEKGITLIALVITIIVLLILAGVAIAMISGDGSIPEKAQDAAKKTAFSDAKSSITTEAAAILADYYDVKYNGATISGIDKAKNAGENIAAKLSTQENHYASGITLSGVSSSTDIAENGKVTLTLTLDNDNKWYGTLDDKGTVTWKAALNQQS